MTAEVRQRSDARDNRVRILAVARAALAAEGLGVPIREIARRAEVAPATVYRHFPTRDALFAAAAADPASAPCSAIVERGLAETDPWRGFRHVVGELMRVHAHHRPSTGYLRSDRERAARLLLRLITSAKASGELRADLELEDVVVALMANEGIRAGSPAIRAAASRRFAVLTIESFRARPEPAALPPAVRVLS